MDDSLNSILQIAPDESTPVEQAAEIIQAELVSVPAAASPDAATPALPASVEDPHEKELNDDMSFAREQIKELAEEGRSALQGALELAASGDEPRAYEVVGQLIDALTKANKELIQLHKTRKEAKKADKEANAAAVAAPQAGSGSINVKNAVFVGRAQDLLRALKETQKELDAHESES